jgi:hypothetical protein
MAFICSICSDTFSNDKDLKAHKKSLHNPTITCKFHSSSDLVTLVRQDNGYFQCPACGVQKQEYMAIYNHCTRTRTTEHILQVTAYLTSVKTAPPQNLNTQAFPGLSQSSNSQSNYHLADALCRASQKVFLISVVSSITLTTFIYHIRLWNLPSHPKNPRPSMI